MPDTETLVWSKPSTYTTGTGVHHGYATAPAVIVDPFGGTGTVAGVAKTLGRYGISNDVLGG